MLPSQFIALDRYEKAFVIACINKKIEEEKEQEKKMNKGKGKGKRRR